MKKLLLSLLIASLLISAQGQNQSQPSQNGYLSYYPQLDVCFDMCMDAAKKIDVKLSDNNLKIANARLEICSNSCIENPWAAPHAAAFLQLFNVNKCKELCESTQKQCIFHISDRQNKTLNCFPEYHKCKVECERVFGNWEISQKVFRSSLLRYAEQECVGLARCDFNPVCIRNFRNYCADSLVLAIGKFNVTESWSSLVPEIKLINNGFFEFEERMACQKNTCGLQGYERCLSIDFVHFKEDKKKEYCEIIQRRCEDICFNFKFFSTHKDAELFTSGRIHCLSECAKNYYGVRNFGWTDSDYCKTTCLAM